MFYKAYLSANAIIHQKHRKAFPKISKSLKFPKFSDHGSSLTFLIVEKYGENAWHSIVRPHSNLTLQPTAEMSRILQ